MMTEVTKAIESRLKKLSGLEIEQALANAEPQVLIGLLDSKSIKVGDCAATMIKGSNAYRRLISSMLQGQITTKLGKIRANNMLFSTGRKYPDALKAYLTLLNDPNDEVADNALLALVLWGDKQVLPAIRERAKRIKSAEDVGEFVRACDALGRSDPKAFNPHFTDDRGIWN